MKITTVQSETKVQFCQLKEGEVFRHNDVTYIKLPTGYNSYKEVINAFSFVSGVFVCFKVDELIVPVKSELTIKHTLDIKDLLICEEEDAEDTPWDI